MSIRKLLLLPFLSLLYLFILLPNAFAGGGRFTLDADHSTNTVGAIAQIEGKVYQAGSTNTIPSVGEHVEFLIDNPKDGDSCTTRAGTSSNYGDVTGECMSQSVGAISVYIQSLDNGDQSSRLLVYFVSPPTDTAAPTIIPTSIPTPTLVPTITVIAPTTRQVPVIQNASVTVSLQPTNIPKQDNQAITYTKSASASSNASILAMFVLVILFIVGYVLYRYNKNVVYNFLASDTLIAKKIVQILKVLTIKK